MDDARELQYGIGFETEEADIAVDELLQKVDELEKRLGAVEMGAQQFGAGAVSACKTGQEGVESFTGAVEGASAAMEDVSAGARTAADTTQQFGHGIRDAGDALDDVSDKAQTASETTRLFGSGLNDAGDDADAFRAKIRAAAQEADDLGDAFRTTMADGLDAGQSIVKSFGTGVTGALDFSKNKVKTFVNDTVKGAKNIVTAFQNPIKTIRNHLVEALRTAKEAEDETGDGAEDTERDLEDMGDAGEDAGNQIKDSISGAIKAFVGFEVIKKGIELLKQFGTAAIEAFGATENTAAKFDTLFTSEASDWVDNYADAVHRSTDEVKNFMVQNDAMYRNMGITADAAQELSEITTSLAYDLGNAFHMDDAEALSVLQSAIEGSTDALTEYGITLDDTALKNSAAALGLGTNIEALDDAAMAQVRLNAILEQSGDIQQAAITQTGGLTNSLKSLKGEMSDFMANAGEKFAPALEEMVGVFLDEWPELEPTLLSFVELLADGLSGAVPVLTSLAKSVVPPLIDTLGTLFDNLGPILTVFGDMAQEVLPPLANIISELAAQVLPPLRDIFEELNTRVIQPLMPVIEELAGQLLPVLGMALSSVASLVGPLADAFMPLLEEILPVFGSLISTLASSIIPPLTEILQVVIQALQPIIDLAIQIVDAILPAVTPLIEAVGTILSGVIVPVLEAISPALSFIADVLGTVVGWISDLIGFLANGVSKVVGFFSNLFGGAKESTDAVEGLTGAVNDLDGAAGTETSLAIDTSEYSSSVSAASQEATDAVTEASTAAREISNENYTLMADDAETAYARMTLDAEEAWERMTTAADEGAKSIVASFASIATAAQSVNNASITVSGVDIPHNAEGTDDFEGGWTHMNEEGGELAYLPSGTAIIPADKTDEIINNSTSNEYVDSSTFAPQISISIGGDGSPVDLGDIDSHILKTLEKWYKEKKEQELHGRAMQGAYAR